MVSESGEGCLRNGCDAMQRETKSKADRRRVNEAERWARQGTAAAGNREGRSSKSSSENAHHTSLAAPKHASNASGARYAGVPLTLAPPPPPGRHTSGSAAWQQPKSTAATSSAPLGAAGSMMWSIEG